MKILANLVSLVKRTDSNLPFGKTIQDETETQEGTPIIADLMQDFFSNWYRLLEMAKITPTDNFDGDSTQYQLVDALKKLPNDLNDVERVLTLDGTVWSVPFDLSILPNKYFFIARASEDYIAGTSYTFKGTGTETYSFTSKGFKSGSQIIVVIDLSGVRAYLLHQDLESIFFSGNKAKLPIEFQVPEGSIHILKQIVEGEGSYAFGFGSESIEWSTPNNSFKLRIDSPDTSVLFEGTGGIEKKVAYKDYVTDPQTLIDTLNNCDSTQLDEIKTILGI